MTEISNQLPIFKDYIDHMMHYIQHVTLSASRIQMQNNETIMHQHIMVEPINDDTMMHQHIMVEPTSDDTMHEHIVEPNLDNSINMEDVNNYLDSLNQRVSKIENYINYSIESADSYIAIAQCTLIFISVLMIIQCCCRIVVKKTQKNKKIQVVHPIPDETISEQKISL